MSDISHILPAEWDAHASVWTAWPSHEDLWGKSIEGARSEFVNLCRMIWNNGEGESIDMLVLDEKNERLAKQAFKGVTVRFHRIPFGDIWLRDTAPIFVRDPQGAMIPTRFAFNGWGEKYILPHDADVAKNIQAAHGGPAPAHDWILEGGAIESDGLGTCLTTEQCLLNLNRCSPNTLPNRERIEARLSGALGFKKFIWLKQGLLNDHTDGHVDTLARFVAPGTVAIMMPTHADDPNAATLHEIKATLAQATDAQGLPLKIVEVPSPGAILNGEDKLMPASYLNFYIGNTSVVVPTYGSKQDERAVETLAHCFPGRRTVGVYAKTILEGGGAFHCITQQQPVSAKKE